MTCNEVMKTTVKNKRLTNFRAALHFPASTRMVQVHAWFYEMAIRLAVLCTIFKGWTSLVGPLGKSAVFSTKLKCYGSTNTSFSSKV